MANNINSVREFALLGCFASSRKAKLGTKSESSDVPLISLACLFQTRYAKVKIYHRSAANGQNSCFLELPPARQAAREKCRACIKIWPIAGGNFCYHTYTHTCYVIRSIYRLFLLGSLLTCIAKPCHADTRALNLSGGKRVYWMETDMRKASDTSELCPTRCSGGDRCRWCIHCTTAYRSRTAPIRTSRGVRMHADMQKTPEREGADSETEAKGENGMAREGRWGVQPSNCSCPL